MKKGVEQGASPQVTSEAILHAISSITPKTRYVVGNGDVDGKLSASTAMSLLWLMPDRLKDLANKAQLEDFAVQAQKVKEQINHL